MLHNHRQKATFYIKWLTQHEFQRNYEKKNNSFLQYLTYFWGPLPWMIEGMLMIMGIFRLWEYFFILLFMLIANSLVSLWLVFQKEKRLR